MSRPFWLVLSPHVWQEGIGQLAARGRVGVARVTRNFHAGRRELIAREVIPLEPATRGAAFGPFDDLLLVELSRELAADAPARMIREFAPQATQSVAAVTFGVGPHAGRWSAAVLLANQVDAVEGLSFVGPGMRQISTSDRAAISPIASDTSRNGSAAARNGSPAAQNGRWIRTRGAVGDAVFERFRTSSIAVVGASRTGSVCSTLAAMLGARRIILIDDDIDEVHHLDAVLNATAAGVGRPKVLNRAAALRRIRNDDFAVEPIAKSVLDPEAVESLRDADLIVTCVDRDEPRLAVATISNLWCKVQLDVSTGVFFTPDDRTTTAARGVAPRSLPTRRMGADVRLLLPGTACVSCLGGLRAEAAAQDALAQPRNVHLRRPHVAWNDQRAGSLVTVNVTAAGVALQLYLDLIAGRVTDSRWCRIEWTEHGELQVTTERTLVQACEVCHELWQPHSQKP